MHGVRADLLQLRQPGEHRLEGHVGRRMSAVQRDISGTRGEPDRSDLFVLPKRLGPLRLMGKTRSKDVLVGFIDVVSDIVESPEDGAAAITAASEFVVVERLFPRPNRGKAPTSRSVPVTGNERHWRATD